MIKYEIFSVLFDGAWWRFSSVSILCLPLLFLPQSLKVLPISAAVQLSPTLVLHMALAATFIFCCCFVSARFVRLVHHSDPLFEDFNPRRGASAGAGPGSGRPAQKRSHCLLPASFPWGQVPVSGVSSTGISPALRLQLSQLQELAGLVAGSDSAASSASTGEVSVSAETQHGRKRSRKAAAPRPKKEELLHPRGL